MTTQRTCGSLSKTKIWKDAIGIECNTRKKNVLCSAEKSSVIWAEPHIRSLAKPNILSVNTMAYGCQFSCPLGMGAIWNEKNLEWLWSTLTFTHLENFLEFSRQLAGALSPALVHSAHLQQLQAHLIRSASTSPFLSPQNSLQAATLLHSSAAAAAAVSAAASLHATSTNPYFPLTINPGIMNYKFLTTETNSKALYICNSLFFNTTSSVKLFLVTVQIFVYKSLFTMFFKKRRINLTKPFTFWNWNYL